MLFTSTSLKTMLFVSLAMLSNAALPPWVQQEREEGAIRNSSHMKEIIGKGPKFGITNIEAVHRVSEIAGRDGYTYLNEYKVSCNTHGEGCWMTQQGYINRDFTVYSVESKKALGRPGPINFGLMFEDDYVEDPAAGQSGYVNAASTLSVSSNDDPAHPADCNGVVPRFPPLGPGPVIIDPKLPLGPGPVILPKMIKLNQNRSEQCLPTNTTVGYFTEHQMVATHQAQPLLGNDVLPYRSHDRSVVTCKLVDTTPQGFCGGKIYRQEFIAHKYGRTTVTNGPVTYTIQVGLLNN